MLTIVNLYYKIAQIYKMKEFQKQKCSIEQQIFELEYPSKRHLVQKLRKADLMLCQQYQPDSILCRDEQMAKISQFISQFLATGISKQCLYLSGSPGIGKTLCVNKTIQMFKEKQITKKSKVKFATINAMRLKHPYDLYKNIYYELSTVSPKKKKITSKNAMYLLDGIFRKNVVPQEDMDISTTKKIIVIDQIDYLKTKDQQILYVIFDWIQSQNSKLAIIAISNTFDFPEKLLPKITSRMGNCRLSFSPYKAHQLEQIILQRVEGTEAFQKSAISFVAKKLTRSVVDIRKLLHILRESIIIHAQKRKSLPNKNQNINQKQVSEAYDKISNVGFAERYRCLPLKYRYVLRTLSEFLHYGSSKAIAFESLKQKIGIKQNIEQSDLIYILESLKQLRLIDMKYTSRQYKYKEWNIKLHEQVKTDDINHASHKYDPEEFYI